MKKIKKINKMGFLPIVAGIFVIIVSLLIIIYEKGTYVTILNIIVGLVALISGLITLLKE